MFPYYLDHNSNILIREYYFNWNNIGQEDSISVGETATYWATVFIFQKAQQSGVASITWDRRGANTLELKIDHGRMHVRSQGTRKDWGWWETKPDRNPDSAGSNSGK